MAAIFAPRCQGRDRDLVDDEVHPVQRYADGDGVGAPDAHELGVARQEAESARHHPIGSRCNLVQLREPTWRRASRRHDATGAVDEGEAGLLDGLSGSVTDGNGERLAVEIPANDSEEKEGDTGNTHGTHPFANGAATRNGARRFQDSTHGARSWVACAVIQLTTYLAVNTILGSIWTGVRVVEGTGLENRHTGNGIVSSNLTLSVASFSLHFVEVASFLRATQS